MKKLKPNQKTNKQVLVIFFSTFSFLNIFSFLSFVWNLWKRKERKKKLHFSFHWFEEKIEREYKFKYCATWNCCFFFLPLSSHFVWNLWKRKESEWKLISLNGLRQNKVILNNKRKTSSFWNMRKMGERERKMGIFPSWLFGSRFKKRRENVVENWEESLGRGKENKREIRGFERISGLWP